MDVVGYIPGDKVTDKDRKKARSGRLLGYIPGDSVKEKRPEKGAKELDGGVSTKPGNFKRNGKSDNQSTVRESSPQ